MGKRSLGSSFAYAIKGILYVVVTGRNMKIHLLAAVLVVLAGHWLGVSRLEWAILSFCIFAVLAAETFNTAVEKTVDLVTRDYHPLAKHAKNIAAGGVLLTAINAVIIALLVFGPYLF